MQYAVGLHLDLTQQRVGVTRAVILFIAVLVKAAEGAVGGAKRNVQIQQALTRRRSVVQHLLPGLLKLFFGDRHRAAPGHRCPTVFKGLAALQRKVRG